MPGPRGRVSGVEIQQDEGVRRMSDFPPPLTPARSDLRDFGWMPLEIVRFRGSDLLTEDAEIILAAVMLWTAAWHETPAASLSDDDKLLAKAAGFGRSVDTFRAIKAGALRGFIKCSDGRLYHPVVARLANEAWKGKIEQRHRTEVARIKKHNERHPDDARVVPSFETFAAHYPESCPDDKAVLSQGQLILDPDLARAGTGAIDVPETSGARPQEGNSGQAECRGDSDHLSQRQGASVATTGAEKGDDIGSKGKGKGKGKGDSTTPPNPLTNPDSSRLDRPDDLASITNRIAQAGCVSIIKPTAVAREMDIVKRWMTAGIDVDDTILPVIKRRLADLGENETVGSLLFYDAAVLKAHNVKHNGKRRTEAPLSPIFSFEGEAEEFIVMRQDLASSMGPTAYCTFAHSARFERVDNRNVVRVTGRTADKLKDGDSFTKLRQIAAKHGFTGVW